MENLEDVIISYFGKRVQKPKGKTRAQIALARGASDVAPTPSLKRFFLIFSGVNKKIGERFGLSPGSRVYDCEIGDDVSVGINSYVKNCVLEDNVRIGANTVVEGCRVAKNSIVASNAIVTEDVPENSWVRGYNLCEDITKSNGKSPQIESYHFDKNPFWHWMESLSEAVGSKTRVFLLPVGYTLMNHMPRLKEKIKGKCNDEVYDYKLRRVKEYCNVKGNNSKIHPSVLVDSTFPEKITIGDNVKIGKYTLLLTHSFINKEPNTFIKGPITIGDNVDIGDFCTVLPGTVIPDNTRIPSYSAANPKSVYCPSIAKKCIKYTYEDLKHGK